ncbi:MAG: sigma-54-dependent Fis family transcriptional regulator [Burkholderiaceae bacterium]|nr:MAG: sigma-54-dependent Fis family transcriptional regulator [Burkholderiaceae bacterium]
MDSQQRQHIDTVLDFTSRLGGTRAATALSQYDPVIRASWQRCIDAHGLDPTRMQEARILPWGELREHQERVEEFTQIARHGLSDLYRQVAGIGYVVLLTDGGGVTVDYLGDQQAAAQLRRAGLYLGSDWEESHAGTCAVGTALSTGSALTVHQTDHFDATHIPLTCTAAPIYDSGGQLNAILDISALVSPAPKASQQLALQLVKVYAYHIENAHFMRVHRHDWIVRLAGAPAFVDVNPDFLLALDTAGHIIGHNRRAQQMLEHELDLPPAGPRDASQVLGRSFQTIFDTRVEQLGHYLIALPAERRVLTLTRSGRALFAGAMPPVPRPKPSQGNSAPEPILIPAPLAALSGGDPVLTHQLQRAARLVDAPINLLIHGETGTGKEYFAKALHAASARHRRPFVAVNCAAIPETLIESELFGHLPGSFSGAGLKPKRGLIQEADGGTLFLDEIGDMPLGLQTRLLRVLAEHEVLAIGAAHPVPVDLHVISATHHALMEAVREGRFREDLYYRLNGALITLPPLRQRTDLDWLIDKFLGGRVQIEPAARALLVAHSWPGNLRELANVLEYARAVCGHDVIERSDLPDDFCDTDAPHRSDDTADLARAMTPQRAESSPHSNDLDHPQPDAMLLMQTLRAAGWNVSAVARRLGVSRMTVYRRMERLGIRSPNRKDTAERKR